MVESKIYLLLLVSGVIYRLLHAHHINNPLHLLSSVLTLQKE